MTPKLPHFAVIGGGITGLSAALHLEAHAQTDQTPIHITLLEASTRLGGKLKSEHVGDFIIDAGADVFMARKPEGIALCRTLGLANDLRETNPATRNTYIREHDSYTLTPITMYENEPLATLVNGIQELPDATAKALKQTAIRYESQTVSIEPINHSTEHRLQYEIRLSRGEPITADAVIIAVPARATASILASIVPKAEELLRTVTYTTTTTVSAGFRRKDVPHPLNGYGYLVRNATPGNVSACTWSSSKISGRAPADHVLLRAFVRGMNEKNSPDTHRVVLEEFRNTLGITADPLFIRKYPWAEAVPLYASDHAESVKALDSALAPYPHCVVAGSAIDATGIPDSIRSGTSAANVVWNQIIRNEFQQRPIHTVSSNTPVGASIFSR